MAREPFDPLGHIKLSVSDAKTSKEFYNKLLTKLGYNQVAQSKLGGGWKSPQGFGFWIEQAESKEPKYKFSSPGLHHFCFKADSEKQVDEFYVFLVKEKIKIYDPPQTYPRYTDKYYAVFFADPDGVKLELAYY